MSGRILLVDKPSGWTSFDVVAKIRSAVRAQYAARGVRPTKRQLKVGHAGTLDPFATGLLVVLLGDACGRAGEFLKLDKVYEATFELGKTSTTGDPEGEINSVNDRKPARNEVIAVLQQCTGEIHQTPPVYSAIKINGQRAYHLARQGKEVAMPSRAVTIYQLDMVKYDYPFITLRVHVSSGTYIRALAEDMGQALGTGAYCRELRRLSVGSYDLGAARTVEELLRTQPLYIDHSDDDQQLY